MWEHTYNKRFKNVKGEDVWQILIDVNNWPSWHNDLEYCKMEAAFEEGNSFTLKPKGAPAVEIKLIEIKEGHSFTDCTSFFGAKMYDTHIVEEIGNGVEISNKIVVKGPLSWLWSRLVARNIAKTVPQDTERLVKLARSKNA